VYAVPLATAFAGTASVHVGVNVWLPMPVFAEALNSFVAVGATVAAGNVYGKLTVVVAGVHPAAPVSHDAVGADWIVVAVVGSAFEPDLNVVEVLVTFQPAPEPVASPMSNASVPVTVWLVPLSVVVGNVTVAAGVLLTNARLPALSVTDAAVVACEATGSAATPAAASAESAASHARRFLKMRIFRPPNRVVFDWPAGRGRQPFLHRAALADRAAASVPVCLLSRKVGTEFEELEQRQRSCRARVEAVRGRR
jgi:hypothetical protein